MATVYEESQRKSEQFLSNFLPSDHVEVRGVSVCLGPSPGVEAGCVSQLLQLLARLVKV